MTNTLAETLKGATPEVLQEIVREAESRLAAQLSTALAADMRAMTFLGFISAVVVATIGFSMSTFDQNQTLAIIAFLTGSGFASAGFFAFVASRPIDFEFVGNNPDEWVADIERKISLHDALAEQAQHYNAMLHHNREAMRRNSSSLVLSASIVLGTVVLSSLLVLSYMTGILPHKI